MWQGKQVAKLFMPVTCFIFTWFILKWTGPGFPLEREEIEAVLPSTVYLTRILIKAEQSTATGRSTWLCECVVADGVGLPSLPIIFADEGETSPLGTWPGALDLAIDSPPSPLPLLPPRPPPPQWQVGRSTGTDLETIIIPRPIDKGWAKVYGYV